MGLREQAKLDARAILEDDSGFAWPVTLTSPLGVVTALRGFTTDVGQVIDPETGQAVAGRRASFAFPLSSLGAMPEAVADRGRKPWLATFADSTGAVATWKVIDVLPDRATGVVVLILEVFKPAIVALTGGLVLPSQQLSGSFSPSIVGALALPSQQLTGGIAPAVSLAGAPSLPSLLLSGSLLVPTDGFVPSDISVANGGPLSAWLRVVNATLVSGDVSSLPDALNANPAVQAVAGSRPTVENSANGLPCMRFAGTDNLSWPLAASNDSVNQWGIGLWLKPDAVITTQMIWFPCRAAASVDRFQLYLNVTRVEAQVYISNGVGRFGQTALSLITTGQQFVTVEYDKDGATEAEKLVVTVAGIARSLSFANLGAGGTIGALTNPTGNGIIGLNAAGGIPFTGLMGPNIYVLSAKMPGATVGLLTPQARLDLMNYQRPT